MPGETSNGRSRDFVRRVTGVREPFLMNTSSTASGNAGKLERCEGCYALYPSKGPRFQLPIQLRFGACRREKIVYPNVGSPGGNSRYSVSARYHRNGWFKALVILPGPNGSIAHIKIEKIWSFCGSFFFFFFFWIVHEPSISPVPHTCEISEAIATMYIPNFPRKTGDRRSLGSAMRSLR